MPTYRIGTKVYDIPPEKVEAFESKNPEAEISTSYKVGEKIYDIPFDKEKSFKEKFPDSEMYDPFKKKDQGPSDFGLDLAEDVKPPELTREELGYQKQQQLQEASLMKEQGVDTTAMAEDIAKTEAGIVVEEQKELEYGSPEQREKRIAEAKPIFNSIMSGINEGVSETTNRLNEIDNMRLNYPQEYTDDMAKELDVLNKKSASLQKSKKIINEANNLLSSREDKNTIERFVSGFKSVDGLDLLSLGIKGMSEQLGIAGIAKNYEKDPSSVSDEDKDVLAMYSLLEGFKNDVDTPISYNVAASLAESIPFLVTYAATGGVGGVAKEGAKKYVSNTVKKYLGKEVNKYVLGAVGMLAETGTRAAIGGAPGIIEDFAGRAMGDYDISKEGEPVKIEGTEEGPLEAAYKSLATGMIEYGTESLGKYLPSMKIFDKLGKNNMLRNIKPEFVKKLSTDVGFDGMINEFAEEMIGSSAQALATGDRKLSDVWTKDELLTTALSTGLMSGVMGGANLTERGARRQVMVSGLNKSAGKLTQETKAKVDQIMNEETDMEDKGEELNTLIEGSDWTNEQKKDVFTYATNKARFNGYRETQNNIEEQQYEEAKQALKDKSEGKVPEEKVKAETPPIETQEITPRETEITEEKIGLIDEYKKTGDVTSLDRLKELDTELKTIRDAREQQSGEMRQAGLQEEGQSPSDQDMPEIDRTELQDRAKVEEDKIILPQFKDVQRAGMIGFAVDNKDIKKNLQKYTKARGLLPGKTFDKWISTQGKINAQMKQVEQTGQDFNRALQDVYGKTKLGTPKVSQEDLIKINDVMGRIGPENAPQRDAVLNELPEQLRAPVADMRNHIDVLSREMVRNGVVEGDLAAKFDENMGYYLTRTYKQHTDKNWTFENIPDDIKNRAISYVKKEMPELDEAQIETNLRSYLLKDDGPLSVLNKGKMGSKDLGVLKPKQVISKEIRELLGEHKDPLYNYSTSVAKMSSLIAKDQFLIDIKEEGLKSGWLTEKQPKGENIAMIAAEGSKTMSPLNGLYTTPEIKKAFNEFGKSETNPKWLRIYMKYLNVPAKYTKTILSPITHIRNYGTNFGFHVLNGRDIGKNMVPILRSQNLIKKGGDVAIADLKKTTDPVMRERLRKYTELGVIGESVQAGELQDAIQDTQKYMEDFDKHGDDLYKKAFSKTKKGIEKMYQLEDEIHKIYTFEYEKDRYKKALLTSGVEESQAEAQAEEQAAMITRNTMPTYSLVPEAVKKIRQIPLFGTFVSFPAEVIRTTGNTIDLALKEFKSENPEIKKIGQKRIAGLMIGGTIPSALAGISQMLMNVDGDDEEALRRFVPEWSKNSNLAFVSKDKKGNPRYIDLSYSDPLNYFKKPINALIKGGDGIDEKFAESMKELYNPFLGEEMVAQKLLDWRSNKDNRTGRELYNPEKTGEKWASLFTQLYKSLEPGAVGVGKRIVKSLSPETEQEVKYNRTYNLKDEATALLTGQRVSTVDPERGFQFKMYEYGKQLQDANKIYSQVKYKKGATEEQRMEAKAESEKRIQKITEEVYKDYNAALQLGVEDKVLKRVMNKLKAGPYLAAPKVRKAVRTGEYKVD